MAESLGDAVLELRTDQRKFNRGIDEAERKTRSLESRFKAVGRSLSGLGDKLTIGLTLPIVAAAAATFKLASDAEENANKFNVVFGGAAESVRDRLQELTETIPLTRSEMEGLSAGIQDLLVPMGVARETAAGFSGDFVELAGDMASFNNVPVAKVLADIQSALAGSSEPMQKYGVDTKVAALQAIALEEGLIKQGEELNNAARAQAILLQVTRQTSDAQGDAANTVDSAANSVKFLAANFRQLAQDLGEQLIPIVLPLIQSLRDLVATFAGLDDGTKRWIVQIALAFAAIGPLLSIGGRLVSVLGSVVASVGVSGAATAATGSVTALNAALGKAGLVAAAGAAGFAVGSFVNEFVIGNQAFADAFQWFGVMKPAIKLTAAELETMALRTGEAAEETRKIIPLTETFLDLEKRLAKEAKAAAKVFEEELTAAINSFGLVTQEMAIDKVALLELALSAGGISVEQMRVKVRALWEELKTAGNLTSDLAGRLNELSDGYASAKEKVAAFLARQGELPIIMTTTAEFTERAAEAMDVFDFNVWRAGIRAEDAKPRWDALFDSIGNTGIEAIDRITSKFKGLLGIFKSITGALSGVSKGFGSFFSKIGGMFSGGGKDAGAGFSEGITGVLGGSGGLMGKVSGFLSAAGPWVAVGLAVAGPLLKGLTAGLKAVGGFIKGLFGGPDAAEKAGRSAAAVYRDSVRAELSADILADVKLQFPNQVQNAAFLASIQQKLIAAGVAAEAAGVQAQQWGIKLFEAEKQGGDAVQGIIDQIAAATQAAADSITTVTTTAAAAAAEATEVAADAITSTTQKAAEQVAEATNTAIQEGDRLRDRLNDTLGGLRFDIPVGFNIDKFTGLGSDTDSNITELAHGGIVTKPTVAMLGEGDTDEAVLPLNKRGGLSGGMMQPIIIEIEGERLGEITLDMQSRVLRALGIG